MPERNHMQSRGKSLLFFSYLTCIQTAKKHDT